MLGRPNLARYHCERISLFFHSHLPPDVASVALETTHHHQGKDGEIRAYFGKSYRSQGISYVIEGSLFPHENNIYHVHFRFFESDRGKPPSEYKSPDELLALMVNNATDQPLDFDILADFKYEMGEGWSPRPNLPIELPNPIRANRGTKFTQIDGVRLSNPAMGESSEWVQVNVSGGELSHEVGLVRSKLLNRTTIRSLIREVSGLSLGMVTKKKGVSNGN